MRSKSALTGDNEPALETFSGALHASSIVGILVAASATLDGIFLSTNQPGYHFVQRSISSVD